MRILPEERKVPAPARGESTLPKHFELTSPGEGLGAVFGVELAVDIIDVGFDDALGDEQLPGDLPV